MSNSMHVLAQKLTGKASVEECSLDEVKRIVQRHPYFAPAQFLLLHKLRQSGLSEEADAQYKKAVLFYPDPCAFELFISSGKFYGDKAGEPVVEQIEDAGQPDETTNDKFRPEEHPAPKPEPITSEVILTTNFLPATNEGIKEEAKAGPAAELQFLDAMTVTDENPVGQPADKQSNTGSLTSLKEVSDEVQQTIMEQKTEAVISHPLVFEPYHTVDYFASQGIKISQEELPKDKLGKQLKSFTEWLRTMKRLPAPQVNENVLEKGVEGMADRSVSESEVLTEAMAEVWTKQGIPQKALDIYNKLSLHNPSKRDYFAAKN